MERIATEASPAPAGAPHPTRQATAWLRAVYGGLVELAVPHPVHETDTAWLLSCHALPQPGYPRSPMLAASLVVPKDGGSPFHPAEGTSAASAGRSGTVVRPVHQGHRRAVPEGDAERGVPARVAQVRHPGRELRRSRT
ncbi:hypothetical protein GCM10017752_00110 [Streptomyces roseoviridis]